MKYTNPAIETVNRLFGTSVSTLGILLPIGLSYYTFKSIGYVIDVYRGRISAQRNILKLALYIGYFPALVQGPLDRYEDLAEQLYAEHVFDYKRVCFGAQRMLWGYIKKLVIADRALVVVNTIMGSYADKGYDGFMIFFGYRPERDIRHHYDGELPAAVFFYQRGGVLAAVAYHAGRLDADLCVLSPVSVHGLQ